MFCALRYFGETSFVDRPGQRSNINESVKCDVDHFRKDNSRSGADNEYPPGNNFGLISRLVKVSPGKPGLIFRVQVYEQIDLHGSVRGRQQAGNSRLYISVEGERHLKASVRWNDVEFGFDDPYVRSLCCRATPIPQTPSRVRNSPPWHTCSMGNKTWRALDYQRETLWLRDRCSEEERKSGPTTGFDVAGWEATIWILDAMYEDPHGDSAESHDDRFRRLTDLSRIPPDSVDAVLSGLTESGSRLGLASTPGPGWRRLRWQVLADRLGISFSKQLHPPCFRWFPFNSWPVSIEPPSEGSLDEDSTRALVAHLSRHSGSQVCVASYGFLASGWSDAGGSCFAGPVLQVLDLVDEVAGRIGTPSNVWPVDRSWLVYTDWDLWATKVSGSQQLIEELSHDETLETIQWEPVG